MECVASVQLNVITSTQMEVVSCDVMTDRNGWCDSSTGK